MTPAKTQVSSLQSKSFVRNCVAEKFLQCDPQETILLSHQRYMRQDKMVRVNKVTIKSGVSLG